MSKTAWRQVAVCIGVPAFLLGVTTTLVLLLNNTTIMAPPISPCTYSLDTRCKDELYRGVRWEDYADGAGCDGCKEPKPQNTSPSAGGELRNAIPKSSADYNSTAVITNGKENNSSGKRPGQPSTSGVTLYLRGPQAAVNDFQLRH